ncbi:MAG: bifunctional 4-hydroxy-2-oxoglutarate aldolase/2-dehydro-3-deoxy-phosphogluconate aldolase [Endomicrobiales bacterium]|nr:bifunctional 4-hydroxy-2-oxoglutarate aldolase/2-dehydro-3-deoxy-phosphogluconate aldolase [Endomicrobiales bacterium]
MNIPQFKKLPILGILRGIKKSQVEPVFNASLEAGLNSIEITFNTSGFFDLISYAKSIFKDKIFLGAGTVLKLSDAKDSVKAGATFIVSPNFNKDIADYCRDNQIPFFPGAFTPSEIWNAWTNGATMVKVFPASCFGPKYFKEVLAPLTGAELMAVSGVRPENIAEYFNNGAKAVAVGASVYKREWLETEKWGEIKNLLLKYVENYGNLGSGKA